MAKIEKREKAQVLRRAGTSIADIAAQLMVSKSTVSTWCRDIVLTAEAQRLIVERSKSKSTTALLEYTERLRKARQSAVQVDMNTGARTVGKLSQRDIFCIGLGLYWGEGYKSGSQEFGFTNSDPKMIQFYIIWLEKTFCIKRSDLILRVSINQSHTKRLAAVQEFWSDVTGVSLSQFTKPSLIQAKSKKVYRNSGEHFGTLRIKVRRGTRQRRIVLGAIDSLQNLYRVG